MRDVDYKDAMEQLGQMFKNQNKFNEYVATIYIIEPEFLPSDDIEEHFILSTKQVFSDHKFYLTKEAFNEIQHKLATSQQDFLTQGDLYDILQKFKEVEHIRDWMNFMSRKNDCHRRILNDTKHCDDEHCLNIEHHTFYLNFSMIRFARLCKIQAV